MIYKKLLTEGSGKMLMYKHPKLWQQAKTICKIKKEGKIFKGLRDLKKFVKENENILKL
jgi:hypothetical protein